MDKGQITLYSERLQVSVCLPGSVYRGARFDWSGIVAQVKTLRVEKSFLDVRCCAPPKSVYIF